MEKENEIIELLKQMQNSIDNMDSRICNIDNKIQSMDSKIDKLESGQHILETGQKSILEMLQNIDAKQATNHLEMLNEFKDIKTDISKLELDTAYHSVDIAKLKMAR